jgi:hypothetical protein
MTLPADPLDRIAALIMAKRRETGLGVRAAAEAAKINAATMSRLERRVTPNLPDSATLQKLSVWLEMSLQDLLGVPEPVEGGSPVPSVPEVLEVHLRADHKLSAEKAETLARMFKILYQNAINEPSS